MLCAPVQHYNWRSYSRESEAESWWHNVTGSVLQPWQPGEPTDDGRRARCSLAPCRRFLLESHSNQMRRQCHVVERSVKVSAEAVGWGLILG